MRKRLFGLLTIAALAFGACQGATTTQSPSSGTQSQAAPSSEASPSPSGVDLSATTYKPEAPGHTGGKVITAEWQFIDTLNEYYAQAESDIEVGVSAFEDFVRTTNDLKYMPVLVKELPTVDNGQVVVNGDKMDVTWHLKDGMKWSDGSPITCDDLIATWKWIMDKDNTGLAGGTTGWEDITGIDGTGTTTCVEHFGKVYEGYLTLVAPLLPGKYIQSVAVKDAGTKLWPLGDPTKGVYSGAYIPTAIKTDAQVTLSANPQWKTISGHDPYLDQLIWKYYGDADAMIQGYKAGEFDVANDLNDADIPKTTDIDQKQVVIHDSLTYELFAFQNDHFKKFWPSDYQTVIKAIRMAVDRDAIANGPLSGNVKPINNFVSPLTWYYKDEGAAKPADPTSAEALLTGAGFTKGSDGIYAKGGKSIALDFCTTKRQVRIDTLTLVASQLNKIGIKANVLAKPAQPDVFGGWNDVAPDTKCNTIHGNYDVVEHAWVAPLDPLSSYNVYTCQGNPDPAPHNGQNETRICLPDLDAAWNQVKTNVDFNKVREAMFKVQDIYASDENTYELPLYARKDVWLVNPKLHNFTGNPTTVAGEWNSWDWWIEG
ncbi:MAG TPA: ABC transporter substrate-binding protein [Candidatus Limnocylindrales bacterium]